MATQTGSIDLKAAKAAADIAKDTSAYFWTNTQDSGAGEGVGAHITKITSSEFLADPANGGGNVLIDTDSVDVRDGATNLATFGAGGATIGKQEESQLVLTNDYISGHGEDGKTFFEFNGQGGVASNRYYIDVFNAPANTFPYSDDDALSVTLTQTPTTSTEIVLNVNWATTTSFGTWTNAKITFTAGTSETKTDTLIAASMFTYTITATYNSSTDTISVIRSTGQISQTNNLIATIDYIVQSPSPSYSFGNNTSSGAFALAQGEGNIAEYADQVVIGKYNDNKSTNAFEIGNGTANDARSNALTVDWSGNVEAAGNITANGINITSTTTTTMQLTSGSPYNNWGGCSYTVYGKLVIIHLGLSGLTANTTTTIYTMPASLKPSRNIESVGCAQTATTFCTLEVNTDGDVRVRSPNTYAGGTLIYTV